MVRIQDVADAAGVSVSSVSRALNDHPNVAPATRARVLDAADRLGFRPNGLARSLRTQSTGVLGLIVSDVTNPYFTLLAHAVEHEARDLGYSVVLGNADERPDVLDHHVRTLLDRRVDGLLVSPTDGGSEQLSAALAADVPTVFVDRWWPGHDVPVVRADGRPGVLALVDHLVSLGRRRLAVIAGPATTTTGRERVEAFREALALHDLALPPQYVGQGDFQAASGVRVANEFLDLADPPDAIFAADNLMALGALEAVRARGLQVPDDIALAAFDDVPWFTHLNPPMTTVTQPAAELGRAAVRALVDVIAGRAATSVTLPTSLLVRRSCGEPQEMTPADRRSAP